jgi:hypothetical protein
MPACVVAWEIFWRNVSRIEKAVIAELAVCVSSIVAAGNRRESEHGQMEHELCLSGKTLRYGRIKFAVC